MPKENTSWMTPGEAAARLQITEGTIRRWLRDGKMRGSQLGRVWRIGDADLSAFMESSVPAPGTAADDQADDE